MYKSHAKTRQRGFTLVEMMVGLALLGVFMSGIFGSVRLSTILAETTIYDSTAVGVAQGYLEQIKSLPYEDLLLAVQDPATFQLETISPSYSASQQVTVFDEPLSIDAASQPNERTVTIDIRKHTGTVIQMPMRLWVTVDDLNVGSSPIHALEIKIRYAYQLPNVIGGTWLNGQVQTIRARM
jgi:prepilin-type N-terminal cleavage/methylation domain-containing protein